MKAIVIGGNFGPIQKTSSIVRCLFNLFTTKHKECHNGGQLENLPKHIDGDLIIWMPNIANESAKQYPVKSVGSVLICSKLMRHDHTDIDAVSRIFNMKGNAVIAIYPGPKFRFRLLDALANCWYDGYDIKELHEAIIRIFNFTKSSSRVGSKRVGMGENYIPDCDDENFMRANRMLQKCIQVSTGNRFFGNLSTRCSKLFPSLRSETAAHVSPRNVSKASLQACDMVYAAIGDDGKTLYAGANKPSVDSPIQLRLYQLFQDVNYMIHGHAFCDGAPYTTNYYPCGDIREVDELAPFMIDKSCGIVNLKNHGFTMWASNLKEIRDMIDNNEFNYERSGE